MWRERVIYGTLALSGLFGLLAWDAHLSRPAVGTAGPAALLATQGGLTTALLVLFAVAGAREACGLVQAAGHRPARIVVQIAVAVLVAIPWLTQVAGSDWQWTGVTLSLALLTMAGVSIVTASVDGTIAGVGSSLLMIVYVGFLAAFGVRLRVDLGGPVGAWALLYFLLVVKSADIGAYVTGRLLGRHRIVPAISPSKTLEGFLGGGVLAVIVAYLASRVLLPDAAALGAGQSAVFGLVMGLLGPAGDLFESILKRDAGVKDSGRRIPAFGGVLDMMDSPLFAAPAAWWLLTKWLAGA